MLEDEGALITANKTMVSAVIAQSMPPNINADAVGFACICRALNNLRTLFISLPSLPLKFLFCSNRLLD